MAVDQPTNFNFPQRIPPKELTTLLKVSSALAATLELPVVLQTAIESAVEVLGLDTGAIYLLEDEWLFLGATTPPLDPNLNMRLASPEPLNGHPHLRQSLQTRQPVYVTDARCDNLTDAEATVCNARGLRSILFIPLYMKEKPTGNVIVGTTGAVRDFTEHEINLCRILSNQISMAVANARLFQSVQQSNIELLQAYDATLSGWSLALEMRDQETRGHTQRVVALAEKLARKIDLPEDLLPQLRRGALMHDIGKMSIPDTILKKPGPLTEEEWVIMRRHPRLAYEFLLKIAFLAPALDIPYCHHEKWDGTGYPRGLRGEDIPILARVFAVADVFDALTSDRPYRPAWHKETALQYIRDQMGKHFDPQVARIFLEEMSAEL